MAQILPQTEINENRACPVLNNGGFPRISRHFKLGAKQHRIRLPDCDSICPLD